MVTGRLERRGRRRAAAAFALLLGATSWAVPSRARAQPVATGPESRRAQPAAAEPGSGRAQAIAAEAESRTASLGWARLPGAATCAGGGVVARAVETILRRQALAPASRADLVIEARVERVPGRRRFRAVIEIADPEGTVIGSRTIESAGDDCRKLDEPVALAIALMIDPDAVTRPGPPIAAPPPPPPITTVVRDVMLVPVPVLIARPAPPPARTSEGPWIGVAAAPSLAVGLVPGPGFGVRIGVEVGPPADRPLEGVAWGPSSIRLGLGVHTGSETLDDAPSADSATLAFTAIVPRLELCPTTAWIDARWAITPCLALDAGLLAWTGEDFDTAADGGAEPFVGAGPTVRGRLVVAGPLAVEAGAAAIAPFVRDRFVFGRAAASDALAHQVAPVGGTFDLGLHLGF